jgi:organic hydroperoxide reductase OsmC/OhrA
MYAGFTAEIDHRRRMAGGPMQREHHYRLMTRWQGNRGKGTSSYREYGRAHLVEAEGKPPIHGSADPTFHGDRERWNPEELLLAALSQCHMLSYLHVATRHGVVVVDYTDEPVGTMREDGRGGGAFTSVTLRPRVTIADDAQAALAEGLHDEASRKCFIAASVGFPVEHDPVTLVQRSAD